MGIVVWGLPSVARVPRRKSVASNTLVSLLLAGSLKTPADIPAFLFSFGILDAGFRDCCGAKSICRRKMFGSILKVYRELGQTTGHSKLPGFYIVPATVHFTKPDILSPKTLNCKP